MTAVDKLLYITLLCLADEEGMIKDCDEESIKALTHLYDDPYETDNDWSRGTGFINRFIDNGMITLSDNGHDVIIRNWVKRQGSADSGYERLKRWRDKQKQVNKPFSNDNADNGHDNARIEENRIDKNNTILAVAKPPAIVIEYEDKIQKKEKKQTYSEGFSRCWGIYPRKDKQGPALIEWNKLKPGDDLQDKIYKNIAARKDSEEWTKEGGKFIPYFISYLRDERWLDEVKEPEPIKRYGKPRV